MDFLTETDKQQLEHFAGNALMLEAVKKVLLTGLYHEGTLKADPMQNFILAAVNDELSDEQVGRTARARAEALRILDRAFKAIRTFQKVEQKRSKVITHI